MDVPHLILGVEEVESQAAVLPRVSQRALPWTQIQTSLDGSKWIVSGWKYRKISLEDTWIISSVRRMEVG